MKNKKLGVLGGMGPFATSVFLDKIIATTQAEKDQEHIDTVIINHASLPDRTDAILSNTEQNFLDAIKPDISLLEYSGVANIAIPCNTSHYFYKEMQRMTNVHIINMVESTVQHVYDYFGTDSKVAILATDGTIQSKVYETELHHANLKVHHLQDTIQAEVMKIIYSVKSDRDYQTNKLDLIINNLIVHEGCTCVILACTELSCLPIDDQLRKYCVDALEVLVESSIQLSGKNIKGAVVTE